MFNYDPGVADRSGEFIAQGAQNASQITAQTMDRFGRDMGGMIAGLAQTYSDNKAMEA